MLSLLLFAPLSIVFSFLYPFFYPFLQTKPYSNEVKKISQYLKGLDAGLRQNLMMNVELVR
jgi:hypothetical protein